MAFVSSVSTSSFVGNGKSVGNPCLDRGRLTARRVVKGARASVHMSLGSAALKQMLSKYDSMSEDSPPATGQTAQYPKELPTTYPTEETKAQPTPGNVSSGTSSVWRRYVSAVRIETLPNYSETPQTYSEYMSSMRSLAIYLTAPNNKPTTTIADKYMAASVTKQYKTLSAAASGVYGVGCTEGTVRLMAEDSRIASVEANFRSGHRSAIAQYGDLFETRKQALANAHLCSYEEGLICTFPASAKATVASGAEAIGACARSVSVLPPPPTADEATATAITAERYMIASVEKQCKMRAVPYGVYGVSCSDGGVKLMAEYKRVAALGAKFRSDQLSDIRKAQRAYDRSKYARDNYAHMCSYEEDIYNNYPTVAGAMSAPGTSF